MKTIRPVVWLIVFSWGVAAGLSAQGAGVRVSQDVQQHIGVATQRLTQAHRVGQIDAFAKVLDPGPLAQLAVDLKTAESARVASKAEADRAQTLHTGGGGVSAKDAEAARAQAQADALKVESLRHRLGLEWGPGVAKMSPAQRDRLVQALATGAAALVHVDSPGNDGQAGARFVRIDIGTDSVRGAVIGPARTAEARLQSSGLIVEVTGPSAILLSVGLTQSAHIETASPQQGVVLPRAAIVRFRSSPWVYVRTGPASFERRLVPNPIPQDDGLFVAGGFAQGDEVVVHGAADLFAAEQNASNGAR